MAWIATVLTVQGGLDMPCVPTGLALLAYGTIVYRARGSHEALACGTNRQ